MTAAVQFGQIIWADIADANGIAKTRPAIVVTPTLQIQSGAPFAVVAVTSRVPQPLPADHVLLPWHAQGHPRTGLNRKCAAVCTWIAQVQSTDVQSIAGIVPGTILADILARITAAQRPSAEEADEAAPGEEGDSET